MNAEHQSIDELADAAEGLLDEDRTAFVESHLAGCAECRANREPLRDGWTVGCPAGLRFLSE
jgi:anti-sigma factor RsiW